MILEFLRSGTVKIPREYELEEIRREAEFFALDHLLSKLLLLRSLSSSNNKLNNYHIDGKKRRKGKKGVRADGYYVGENNAFYFYKEEEGGAGEEGEGKKEGGSGGRRRVIFTSGEHRVNNLLILYRSDRLPSEWKAQADISRKFATFAADHLSRGFLSSLPSPLSPINNNHNNNNNNIIDNKKEEGEEEEEVEEEVEYLMLNLHQGGTGYAGMRVGERLFIPPLKTSVWPTWEEYSFVPFLPSPPPPPPSSSFYPILYP